jgi:exosome complex RNA-binding protein Rrp42 (RNase PH superfamily)
MEYSYPHRPDGRHIHEGRQLNIIRNPISAADSSALVSIGHTVVSTGIRFEVAEPVPGQSQGKLVPNVTFCAGSSPGIRSGPPTDYAQKLSQQVSSVLSRLLEWSSDESAELCVKESNGALLWVIHIDAMVLNDAGNIFSAIWISVISALQELHLPSVRLDRDVGVVYYNPDKSTPFLPLRNFFPLPMSFTTFSERRALLLDPTDREEEIFDSRMLLLIDSGNHDKLLHVDAVGCDMKILESTLHEPQVAVYLKQLTDKLCPDKH